MMYATLMPKKMEVTRKNFKFVQPLVENAIETACFIAVDGEFSGIDVNSDTVGPFDTPEDRYHKVRQGSSDFLLFQFGLCAFRFDKETKTYEARPFSFYIFPRPYSRGAPDCRFLCQCSSLDFLATQGFDFNKVFKEGISYLRPADETYLREALNLKHQSYSQFSSPAFFSPDSNEPSGSKGPVSIPEEHKQFIDVILNSVTDFIGNTESQTLQLPKCNGFQRKLIYQSVRQKFTSGIHLETKTGEKKERYIVVSRVTNDDELKKKEEEKQQAELQELEDAIGFTKVITMISKSGKLVIGHNMFLDLIHILHQFVSPLPQDYEEFKSMTSCVFPRLLDTKLMSSTNPFKEKIPSTVLGDLLSTVETEPFSKAEVVIPEDYMQYKINDNNLHEAGYDAYITGRCFISMANYLGSFHSPPISRVTPSSPLLEPFINKLFMMRILDVPYMNLAGEDLQPQRDHVFHVTFPQEWKTGELFQLFSPFGSVHVSWISDTSAYVSLHRREEAHKVVKSLNKKGASHSVMSYEQSRNGNSSLPSKSGSSSEPTKSGSSLPKSKNGNTSSQHSKNVNSSHNAETAVRKRQYKWVADHQEKPTKKMKPLNAHAPPFVSRSITPPVPEEVPEQQNANKAADLPDSTTEKSLEDKMFEEPTNW